MPGAPVARERRNKEGGRDVRQRLRSPLQERDGLDSPIVPEVHDISPPGSEPAITMPALRALLDEKLQPLTDDVKELKEDMGNIKNHARENEEMMNFNIESVSADLAEFKECREERFASMKVATAPETMKA
eukprot:2479967-Pyramimonas_sp.AAC.1